METLSDYYNKGSQNLGLAQKASALTASPSHSLRGAPARNRQRDE